MKKQTYIQIIAVILLLLWIPVSLDKMVNFETFKAGILRQPFSDQLGYILIYTLPFLEVLIVVLIVFHKRVGFGLSSLLMAAFTSYIGLALLGTWDKLPCGCGSVISGMTWQQHFWFNLFFLIISVIGLILEKQNIPRLSACTDLSAG